MLPASEKKAKNESEMVTEYMPFIIYAAIPLIITVIIAFTFGTVQQ